MAGTNIRLTAAWVADATGGARVSGAAGCEFTGVSIDTRTLGAGQLYVAIRGERFDGSDFVPAAFSRGAAGVMVPRGTGQRFTCNGSEVVIEVEDTVSALQALAQHVRRQSGAKVVAITGSAGKTTTKEVAAEFLAAKYRVIRNRGNLNNHIGLPLSLVDLRQRPDVAVVELGMNHAGEISTLVRIAEPDVRVWTNVGDAHLGFFDSIDAIADAKAEILEHATAATILVANADDPRITARRRGFGGRVVTFGIEEPATVHASAVIDRGIAGMAARVSTPRGGFDLETPLLGRSNLANVLAAAAVAVEFEVDLDAIAALAGGLRAASHRGEIVRLAEDLVIIDDSYNSNPTAARRALDVLAHEPTAKRRVAILGEMLELGDRSIELHEEVGRAAAQARIDVLLAVGGVPAAALARAAVASGLAQTQVRHFSTSYEAAEAAVATTRDGDVVLVKGSRGVRTDRVVERLKAERA
ncbi:MAG: UDP-N-acetylmuramoyl-tripeptide--D-alanyl-D-alanine ligase [Blastocatellia bacterium]|nr:MAG: UDP-N-acetylmuramoyl-tripeptide--D-alanyl-D-alanine ligase [Blastocatellia bacterium]